MYINASWEEVKKMEPDSFQWYPLKGQKVMGVNRNTGKFHLSTLKRKTQQTKSSFLRVWLSSGLVPRQFVESPSLGMFCVQLDFILSKLALVYSVLTKGFELENF